MVLEKIYILFKCEKDSEAEWIIMVSESERKIKDKEYELCENDDDFNYYYKEFTVE